VLYNPSVRSVLFYTAIMAGRQTNCIALERIKKNLIRESRVEFTFVILHFNLSHEVHDQLVQFILLIV
jgi:hypothetical protein